LAAVRHISYAGSSGYIARGFSSLHKQHLRPPSGWLLIYERVPDLRGWFGQPLRMKGFTRSYRIAILTHFVLDCRQQLNI